MYVSEIIELTNILIWPMTLLVVVLLFKGAISKLLQRTKSVDITSNGIQLVLENMKKLDAIRRKELSGLSSNEIWILNDFATNPKQTIVDQMNPPLKVGAVSLLEMGLIEKVTIDNKQHVRPTELGQELLDAAKSIL